MGDYHPTKLRVSPHAEPASEQEALGWSPRTETAHVWSPQQHLCSPAPVFTAAGELLLFSAASLRLFPQPAALIPPPVPTSPQGRPTLKWRFNQISGIVLWLHHPGFASCGACFSLPHLSPPPLAAAVCRKR